MNETVFDWELARRIRDHQAECWAIAEQLKMNETVSDWELAGRIRDHMGEGKAIAERLKEQGPLVIDRLLNFHGYVTSLRRLARDAGCSAVYLSRIRRGYFVIPPGLFALLSELLQDRIQHERR